MEAARVGLVSRAQEWTKWGGPRRRPADLPSPRPDLCEYGDVCTKAHSEQELQEWMRRVQTVKMREKAAWEEGLVPYQARLLAEYQGSTTEVLVVSGACEGAGLSGARAA